MKMAPDAWLWLGDSVYGDLNDTAYSLSANWKAATPGHLRRLYNIQKNNPGYVRFMRGTGAKIFGVWDDHDFGDDNADSTYPHKVDSQRAFLDFLDEPKDSPRRKQNGVYSTHLLDNGRIRLILLDVRYNRTPYSEGQDGDFLGEDQWKWFESVLISSQAEVNIIAGGIQFLPPRTTALGIPIAESWTRFPSARERLLNLVLSSGVRAPIFLSGDVHFAEISEAVCSCQEPLENESNYALANESGGGRTDDSKSTPESTLLEFTSSGLTHSWKEDGWIMPSLLDAFLGLPGNLAYQKEGCCFVIEESSTVDRLLNVARGSSF